MKVIAYHIDEAKPIRAVFLASYEWLNHGENRPITVGEAHSVNTPIRIYYNGLHASKTIRGAMKYLRMPKYAYIVELWGDIEEHVCKERHVKFAAQHRRCIAKFRPQQYPGRQISRFCGAFEIGEAMREAGYNPRTLLKFKKPKKKPQTP